MKTMKVLTGAVLMVFVLGFIMPLAAQENSKEIKILTSMHCGDCKQKIEKELGGMVGISSVLANVDTKIVTVKFDGGKTDGDKIMASIKKLGYTAELYTGDKSNNKGSNCQSKCARKSSGCSGSK